MKEKILVIDDDTKLIKLLSQYFSQFELTLLAATHPNEGIRLLQENNPKLVILDVMLPEKSGFEVCKEIRQTSSVPIIMLTARGEVADRIVGLELGADDYLPKPFEPRELLARIQSVLRRGNKGSGPALSAEWKEASFGSLDIDFIKRTAALSGQLLDLTTMEFEILAFFAQHPAQVLSRNEILDHLRGIDWEAYDRSIDVLISRLRQKLHDDPKRPSYLKTVWGSGYMLIAEKTEKGGP